VHPSVPALGKAVINKCFTDYGDEDEVKACVDKYQENRELMDPTLGGIKTLGNTASMYHQPAQNWQVSLRERDPSGEAGPTAAMGERKMSSEGRGRTKNAHVFCLKSDPLPLLGGWIGMNATSSVQGDQQPGTTSSTYRSRGYEAAPHLCSDIQLERANRCARSEPSRGCYPALGRHPGALVFRPYKQRVCRGIDLGRESQALEGMLKEV
jgi:hypothetical protein